MEKKNRPAYPTPMQPGLTKRELIAAMAMQGYLAATANYLINYDQLAEISTKCADSLLAELEKADNP